MGLIPIEVSPLDLQHDRLCKDLQLPIYKKKYAKKGFDYTALKTWNYTPAEIRGLTTLDHFEKQFRAYIKSKTTELPGRNRTPWKQETELPGRTA